MPDGSTRIVALAMSRERWRAGLRLDYDGKYNHLFSLITNFLRRSSGTQCGFMPGSS